MAHNSKRGNRPVVFFLESLTCKVYTIGRSVLGPTLTDFGIEEILIVNYLFHCCMIIVTELYTS